MTSSLHVKYPYSMSQLFPTNKQPSLMFAGKFSLFTWNSFQLLHCKSVLPKYVFIRLLCKYFHFTIFVRRKSQKEKHFLARTSSVRAKNLYFYVTILPTNKQPSLMFAGKYKVCLRGIAFRCSIVRVSTCPNLYSIDYFVNTSILLSLSGA